MPKLARRAKYEMYRSSLAPGANRRQKRPIINCRQLRCLKLIEPEQFGVKSLVSHTELKLFI